MVIFDILELSNDSKTLFIKAHINESTLYKGRHITDIYIVEGKNVLENSISSTVLEHKHYDSLVTSVNEAIFNPQFQSNILFVYIVYEIDVLSKCEECIPCGLSHGTIPGGPKEYNIGVTFDTSLLYNSGLNYLKELGDTCNVPQGFIDFILHWEGFKIAIESEHYLEAVKLFNKLSKKSITSSTNCRCYG